MANSSPSNEFPQGLYLFPSLSLSFFGCANYILYAVPNLPILVFGLWRLGRNFIDYGLFWKNLFVF